MQKITDTLSLEHRNDIAILSIRRNLGHDTAVALRKTYNEMQHQRILIDLGDVTLTSSRGIATLLSIFLESEEKGQQVVLCNVSKPCEVIFEAADILTHVPTLKIFATMDEGVEFFRQLLYKA